METEKARGIAREMKKDGKTYVEIANLLASRGAKTQHGREVNWTTVVGWLRKKKRRTIKKRRRKRSDVGLKRSTTKGLASLAAVNSKQTFVTDTATMKLNSIREVLLLGSVNSDTKVRICKGFFI